MPLAIRNRIFNFAALFALTLVVGCSSPSPRQAIPPVTKIRVLQVAPIDSLYTENKGVPVGILWQAIADRVKTKDFNTRMDSTRIALAPRFTQALVNELRTQGFDASILEGISATDDVDPATLHGTDPVLAVYFSDISMLSSRFRLDYLPRVNVYASLVVPGRSDAIYVQRLYYGVDASEADSTRIPSAPQFAWPSFDAMVEDQPKVVKSYEDGVDALARQVALNISAMHGSSVGERKVRQGGSFSPENRPISRNGDVSVY